MRKKKQLQVSKEKIEQLLKFKEWNQKQLADALKVNESYISRVMLGTKEPSVNFIKKICDLSGTIGKVNFLVYE